MKQNEDVGHYNWDKHERDTMFKYHGWQEQMNFKRRTHWSS